MITPPGSTVFTVMPLPTSSNAAVWLNACKPPFDEAYAASPTTIGVSMQVDAMLTMRPPAAAVTMARPISRIIRNAPRVLMA